MNAFINIHLISNDALWALILFTELKFLIRRIKPATLPMEMSHILMRGNKMGLAEAEENFMFLK